MPGIPDFYQGAEVWDLSLADPDKPAARGLRFAQVNTVEA
jgi:maltooligosyltrehalose synthase